MMGLETMTFAPDIIMMMQECDANQVKGHVHKTVLVMIILNCGINNKGLILTWAENGKCCIIVQSITSTIRGMEFVSHCSSSGN